MACNKFVDSKMAEELNELLDGEHREAIKALVMESANAGYKKGILTSLIIVTLGSVIGTTATRLGRKIIDKYQK